jgi:hypothetical protein
VEIINFGRRRQSYSYDPAWGKANKLSYFKGRTEYRNPQLDQKAGNALFDVNILVINAKILTYFAARRGSNLAHGFSS